MGSQEAGISYRLVYKDRGSENSFVCSPSTDIIMRSFAAILTFVLAINYSLAMEWADSGIKLSNSQVIVLAILFSELVPFAKVMLPSENIELVALKKQKSDFSEKYSILLFDIDK